MRESSNVTAAIHIARDVVQYVAAKVLEVTRKMTLLLSNVTRPPPPHPSCKEVNKIISTEYIFEARNSGLGTFRKEKSTQLCREILITSSTAIRNAMHNNLTRNETKTSDGERT